MTPPPVDEWPTDADGLANIATDATRTQDDHNRALQELLPTIRRVARRVAARFGGQFSEDLIDDAAEKFGRPLRASKRDVHLKRGVTECCGIPWLIASAGNSANRSIGPGLPSRVRITTSNKPLSERLIRSPLCPRPTLKRCGLGRWPGD